MKDYFRWALGQLYLFYCWPTRFRREVEGEVIGAPKLRPRERLLYLLKMLPWTAAVSALASLVIGYFFDASGRPFEWTDAAGGVAFGVVAGVVFGVVGGVGGGMAVGLVIGAAFGVEGDVPFGVAVGMAVGVTFSLALGVELNVWGGVVFGAAVGLALGVALVLVAGTATGMKVGAAVGAAFWLTYFRLVTYPPYVVLAAAAYVYGRWRPRSVARAWRRCPVSWDEVIWLPLPFAGALLTLLARQDREEGFRQITFVVAERRLQRRAALGALAQVVTAYLTVGSVSDMPAVADKLEWKTDPLGGEGPAELAMSLPFFDRAAQHVAQYFTLQNAYRKDEALGHALADLGELQHGLVASGGRYAPRLLRVANEWRRLLEAEREKVGKSAEDAREVPNPFRFGKPVNETEHNVFTGRRDVVRQIEASVLGASEAPTLLLHGARRMGKSSILNQLPRLLGPDFAVAVVDCQNPAVRGSAGTLLRYLSRECSEGLRRKRVGVAPLAAEKMEREPFAVFDEWLDEVERAMPAGMRALFCLDEYEGLAATLEAGWGGALLDMLRHTLQHRPRVALMFTGAHTFGELGPAWTDRFISARRVRVSFLRRGDVELLLTKPIPEFDMKWAAGALDAAVAATGCQPFLTQAVAFELVQHLNERQRKEATVDDVEAAIGRALVSGGEYFANVWSDAGAEGQAVLRAAALGETPPEAPASRAWLREHDVLGEDGDFAVEMVRRWVRMRAKGVGC